MTASLIERTQSLLDYINDLRDTAYTNLTDAIINELEGHDYSIDVSSLPSYWQNVVTEAFNYAKNLGHGWVHHVAIADSHYGLNYRSSIPMANVLMATGLFDKFIHLGDLTDSTLKTQYQMAVDDGIKTYNGDIIFCVGNHDEQINASSDQFVPWSTEEVYYNDLMSRSSTEFTFFDRNRCICTYDDVKRKIRYIILDHCSVYSSSRITGLSAWINEKVGELSSDWACVFLAHGNFISASAYPQEHSAPSNFHQMLALANCKIFGLISGHMHIDDVKVWNDTFVQTSLINDTSLTQTAEGDGTHQHLTKTAGTTDENAVTIISINKSSNRLQFRRIGTCYTEAEGQLFGYNVPNINGKWVSGLYFGIHGETAVDDDSYISLTRYPVVAGGIYKFSNSNSNWNPSWAGICIYSSESASSFISRITPSFSNGGFTFTVEADAKYALFSFTKGSEGAMTDTITFEIVSDPEPTPDPEPPTGDIINSTSGVPFNYTLISGEYFVRTSGETASDVYYKRTPLLGLNGNKMRFMFVENPISFYHGVAFDENDNFISAISDDRNPHDRITFPIGTYSVGLTDVNDNMQAVGKIRAYGDDASVQADQAYDTSDLIANRYITATGLIGTYNGWSHTYPLFCHGMTSIERSGSTAAQNYGAFYDQNLTYISTCKYGSNVMSVDVPSNAYYVMFSDDTSVMESMTYTPRNAS